MTGPIDPTDPLRVLAALDRGPAEPDPGFAGRLRDRLRDAVLDTTPRRNPMTSTAAGTDAVRATEHSVSPYLAVTDARAAVAFYVEVLGAVRRGDPIVMPDGRVGHAEVALGDSVVMMAEQFPEIAHTVAPSGGPALRVEVDDVDVALERARERGATVEQPAADRGHGRQASLRDPFGQRWMLAQAPARTVDGGVVRHGEGGYYTFTVPDEDAAMTFYSSVLGWRFAPGRTPRAWAAEGPGLPGSGIWGGQGYAGWKVMYAVDDLDAAVDRVRAAGGRVGELADAPYGRTADCADDQGVEFWLWQTR